MWLLMELLSYSFSILNKEEKVILSENEEVSQEVSYIEKIDNFQLQEFDANNKLSHFVKANSYFNFNNSPALLLDPEVTTYSENGTEDYILSSERANYLKNGEIKFYGQVDVHSANGITHKMNTDELLVSTETNDLISNKKVTYLGEKSKMTSQGMHMRTKDDKMQLTGLTQINQDNGSKILTKDLYVDQSNDKKHYYSDNKTTYLSNQSKVYADGIDIDMQKDFMQLLGNAKILQNSGSIINTKNLIVDLSGGKEIYKTKDKINYLSDIANIKATGMHYDANEQKIRLTGGVVGRYE